MEEPKKKKKKASEEETALEEAIKEPKKKKKKKKKKNKEKSSKEKTAQKKGKKKSDDEQMPEVADEPARPKSSIAKALDKLPPITGGVLLTVVALYFLLIAFCTVFVLVVWDMSSAGSVFDYLWEMFPWWSFLPMSILTVLTVLSSVLALIYAKSETFSQKTLYTVSISLAAGFVFIVMIIYLFAMAAITFFLPSLSYFVVPLLAVGMVFERILPLFFVLSALTLICWPLGSILVISKELAKKRLSEPNENQEEPEAVA